MLADSPASSLHRAILKAVVEAESDLASLGPLILYDGVCGLCHRTVQFVLPRSREIRFAPLQSRLAAELLKRCGLPGDERETVVFVERGRCYTLSTAVLKLLPHLSGGWPALSVFLLVPRPLRDFAYRWVARNRYRWFGKLDSCRLPAPEQASRFLGDPESSTDDSLRKKPG